MRIQPILSLAAVIGLLSTTAASAQWAVNGNPVCTATGAQDHIDISANGLGGAVMVWQDNRGATTDIYARQIEKFGAAEWTGNGVPLCTAIGGQISPHVVHDGFGYLLYTWEDYRSGSGDLYAAITDRLGNVSTALNGFALCNSTGTQQYSVVTSNQSLGVGYVAWSDDRSGNNDIYAQAFNVNNHGFWTANGLPFCTNGSDQIFPAIAPDGVDGAIVVWQDVRNGNNDIYAQRANLNNQLLWTANGVAVCTQASGQTNPMIVPDGAGGAIVAWQDYRHGSGIGAIYAQRINSSGAPQWAAGGVAVAISTDLIILPKMISDGAGGAIVVWEDDRNIGTTGPDIYAQRINGSGGVQWAANGAVVCSAAFPQSNVDIAPDGAGGVFAAWTDLRFMGTSDVYEQRLNSAGSPQWAANGVPVCTASGNQFNVQIASDASGSLIAWQDRRTGGVDDVYAQRLDTGSGQYGYPQPYITSIVDVPADQGGAVRLTFRQGDGQAAGEEYEIHDVEYHGDDVVWVGTFNGSPTYTVDVLTTAVGVPNTYHILAGFESNFVSGTSIDNLAPPAPTLAGQRIGNDAQLSWNSTAGDIDHYILQRSDLGSDITVVPTSYLDSPAPQFELHYRVRAVDIHGNQGSASNELVLSAQSGVGDAPSVPRALMLLPNFPNPFGASTALHVGVPQAGDVHIEVFDVAGRRRVSRDVGPLAAGWREVIFDGRDDNGRPLANGVYSCRVSAGGETHTLKMIVRR